MHDSIQHILTKLYTYAAMRKDFIEREDFFYIESGVNESQKQQLQKISKDELSFFARSLLIKRFEAAQKFIPAVTFLLNEDARTKFFEFAADRPAHGLNKHLNDAIDFLDHLRITESSDLVKQMAEFEKIILRKNKGLKILKVKFNLLSIRAAIRSGREPKIKKLLGLIIFRNGKLIKNFASA